MARFRYWPEVGFFSAIAIIVGLVAWFSISHSSVLPASPLRPAPLLNAARAAKARIEPTELWEAHDLQMRLEQRGLAIVSGADGFNGEFYVFAVGERAVLTVRGTDERVPVSLFFFWASEDPQEFVDAVLLWQQVHVVLGSYLPGATRVEYTEWAVQHAIEAPDKLRRATRIVNERAFNGRVIRMESSSNRLMGWTSIVELANCYKPWHLIAEAEPVTSWAQMRRGLTLEEVEAFAGAGRPRMMMGDFAQYTFKGTEYGEASVSFDNGRAASWIAP